MKLGRRRAVDAGGGVGGGGSTSPALVLAGRLSGGSVVVDPGGWRCWSSCSAPPEECSSADDTVPVATQDKNPKTLRNKPGARSESYGPGPGRGAGAVEEAPESSTPMTCWTGGADADDREKWENRSRSSCSCAGGVGSPTRRSDHAARGSVEDDRRSLAEAFARWDEDLRRWPWRPELVVDSSGPIAP